MAFARIHPALRAATLTIHETVYYLTGTGEDHTVRSRCGRIRVYWPLSNDHYEPQPRVWFNGKEIENYSIKLAGTKRKKNWSII